MSYRFLSVTKDKSWSETMRQCLTGQAGASESTSSLTEAWEKSLGGKTDLIVLDLELPAAERLGWFRALRGADGGRSFPVVLVSREKTDAEVATAFELG